MCNCIESFATATWPKGTFKAKVKRQFLVETLDTLNIKTGDFETRTYSTVNVTVEGRKTPVKKKVPHNFCPWCGEDKRKG